MRRRGRRKAGDEHGPSHERWLVSYADFVTLLFAFFVVLFASSQSNTARTRQMAAAIQAAFQRLALFAPSSAQPDLSRTPSLATAGPPALAAEGLPAAAAPPTPGAWRQLAAEARKHELEALAAQMRIALRPQLADHEVSVTVRRAGVVVSLQEAGFYASGSAALLPGAIAPLASIARILRRRRNAVRFEGFTDNVPIHNTQFHSNWALSTARAVGLVELFIRRFHFPPQRLSAAGYGKYHPIANNATAAGRRLNRHVDIVILPPVPLLLPQPRTGRDAAAGALAPPHATARKPRHPSAAARKPRAAVGPAER
jgi:chemotaxis protein MotB